jgi:LmbE family N-acetylglucosaminyl deacetylase
VGQVDLIIPRGSSRLINYVREHALVPVIETGAGICHTYFDSDGDLEKGRNIVFNAKTRRVSVCNALDCLIIHRERLSDLASLCKPLSEKNVLIYADPKAYGALAGKYPESLLQPATDDSFGTEFLDYKMAIKTVDSFEEALAHIARYSSKHSESIITENESHKQRFAHEVDISEACLLQGYGAVVVVEIVALYGSAYNVNIKIFNDLQHTITGWPGGKPNADDTYRPERAKPYPKRVVIFSPHPDDDVISMGGTLRRLVEQKHEVHVAYETSGNIAVGDEEVVRFMHFINGFNQLFNNSEDLVINEKYIEIRNFLKEKKDGDMDSRDILTIKGLIRRGEARTACTYNNIPLERCHFLDLPFYETGKIQKNPISEADVEIVRNLLREIKPHQIFVAGDLADPHGTHRVCTDAVFAAVDLEKEEGAKWLKDCRIWMYRGAWAEWEIENIEMAVPISPEELRAKRNSILKHQSQMESAPFLGNDERLFWQRSEDRNRGTATLYDQLGLASYEAMEAFVEYVPL